MPVEHLCRQAVIKVCNTGGAGIEDKSSLLVGDVLGGWGVRGGAGATTASVLILNESDRLDAPTNASFVGDERDSLALEVPLAILQTHSIDLLIEGRDILHRQVVSLVLTRVSFWGLNLEFESALVLSIEFKREVRFDLFRAQSLLFDDDVAADTEGSW